MKSLGHQMILASAGSGKTYALTNRFVRLLACGAPPERIVALTFTRKAAGEFFDEILTKLANAATDAGVAKKIAAEIGEPHLGPADFLAMLRAMVGAMHRLALGTLDGFFGRVVRAFPLELGLGGEFEVLQEHGARLARQQVLRELFSRPGGALDTAQREFVEAFKRATFGAEEKQLTARLDRFITDHQNLYLDAPDGAAWGQAARIWPEGSPWLNGADDAKGAAQVLRHWADVACSEEKQRARWYAFIDAVESWSPGAILPGPLSYILEKAVESWTALEAGEAELVIERKKQKLSAQAGTALMALTRTVFAAELKRRLEMTQGIHAVLRGYEAVYHTLVRRAGKLTFADVQRLLMPQLGAPKLASGFSAEADDGGDFDLAEARLAVDWRLDAKFDHWLLDEFQDTSRGQWSVLRNLIDEVVQDPEGHRSLFYVGDVKQAIYAWRGGDPRLFREIFNQYNAVAPGTLAEGRLDDSWRSGPAIVATVNRVLGDAGALVRRLPGPTAERWSGEWRDHVSARPQLDGQVVWLHGEDEVARAALVGRILDEIKPLERGLSVAVLVQSNDMASWLADYLRREKGLPAVAAADLHVGTDNPLTTAVLALLKAAAHPGDRLAREHVLMTPLAAELVAMNWGSAEALTAGVLQHVHAEGFARTVQAWLDRLEAMLAADDTFSRERARQLVAAAQIFDETGSRDVAEFVQFVSVHVVRDAEAARVVQVMTIHKSKGLGFDVVVLPDLEGNSLATRRRDGLAIQRTDGSTEWVLDLPAKLFHDHDPVLAAHVAEAEAAAAYENLCLFYVALTRAKRALYLITKPVKETSKSDNFPRLLTETLGKGSATADIVVGQWRGEGVFAEGNPEWFQPLAITGESEASDTVVTGIDVRLTGAGVMRHTARTPSGTKGGVVTGAVLFGQSSDVAARFGTAVHAALAMVEWGGATPEIMARWQAAGWGEDVIEEAMACLEAVDVAPVFARSPASEVWRERAFEVVLGDAWITGVFDRVVVKRDAGGRVSAATVYDFKTDRIGPTEKAKGVARYQSQMAVYRQALARLTGLPETQVGVTLVFTALRCVVPVAMGGRD